MASVPLSMDQLESITTEVARGLLEQWAIDDRFTEDEMSVATINAISDTIFVINNFMEHFNYYMMTQEQPSKIITPE